MARPKGSRNRITKARLEAAESSGILPLDYMLAVMRDPNADEKRRDEMARAAAPYLHAKLQAIEHSGPNGGPVEVRAIEISFVAPKPREGA